MVDEGDDLAGAVCTRHVLDDPAVPHHKLVEKGRRPPTRAQKADPMPRNCKGEAAMPKAKKAPSGSSAATVRRRASWRAPRIAMPASTATNGGGRTDSNGLAIEAPAASRIRSPVATRLAM